VAVIPLAGAPISLSIASLFLFFCGIPTIVDGERRGYGAGQPTMLPNSAARCYFNTPGLDFTTASAIQLLLFPSLDLKTNPS
jgi:hypothetical protein